MVCLFEISAATDAEIEQQRQQSKFGTLRYPVHALPFMISVDLLLPRDAMPQTPVMLRKTRANCPHAMMQCKCENQSPLCSSNADVCSPSHPPPPSRPPTPPNLLDHPPPIHRLPRRPLDTPRPLPPHTSIHSLPIPIIGPQRRHRNRRRRRRHILFLPGPVCHFLLVVVHILRFVQADGLL